MLVDERKSLLLRQLAQTGRVIAAEASREIGVSEDTIRRDLRELASAGRLKRVHGGAVPLAPAAAPFPARLTIADDEKAMIGRCAAGMLEPGQVTFIDAGTTALHMARNLPSGLRATVVTHSPNVALELMAHDGLTVELIGGRVFRHSLVTVGAGTLAWLGRFRPDIAFVGATGIHPVDGVTTGDAEEAEVKRQIIVLSGATWILGSSEKVGAVSPFVVAAPGQVDGVLTTSKADPETRRQIAATGCQIVLADA